MTSHRADLHVVAFAGGVGGARLATGLAAHLPPSHLTIIVNTGDDIEQLGLYISPDIDTVMYNLAGIAQPRQGWGICNDTHQCLDALEQLGGEVWFRLGDRDIATHLRRTQLMQQGARLTEITCALCEALGVRHPILPMSDDPCPTMVQTNQGLMDFQTYFVRHQWQPEIQSLSWAGIDRAEPTPEVIEAIDEADLVIFCPSNPFVSIDPILNLRGIRGMVEEKFCLAVSPIIGGKAVKGPAAKMFVEIEGVEASAEAVLRHYQGLIDAFVLDEVDAALVESLAPIAPHVRSMPTMMIDIPAQIHVAGELLDYAFELIQSSSAA